MRTIKFVNDTGTPIKIEAPENLTVGQFNALLMEKENTSFSLSKVVLTELKSKAIFATEDAILPDGELRLFTTVKDPKGNKKGDYDSYSRAGLYDAIKEFKAASPKAAEYFSQYGNITQVSSADLRYLLENYKGSKGKTTNTTVGALQGSKKVAPVKVKASQSNADDSEFKEIMAAQNSFNPRLTRK